MVFSFDPVIESNPCGFAIRKAESIQEVERCQL
jgi:hypothetical protein